MRNWIHNTFSFLLIIFLFESCAPTRYVIPLDRRQQAVALELGGPLIDYSEVTIPVPLMSVSHAYGLKKNLTLHNSLHLTSLSFGVLQLETGILRNLFYNEKTRIGMSYSPAVNFMIDRYQWQARLYPQLDFNAYWYIMGEGGRSCDCPGAKGQRPLLFYTGFSNWIDLATERAHGLEQTKNLYINPQAGFMYMGKKLNFQLEGKWLYSSARSNNLVVAYKGINQMGTVGVYFTVSKFLNHGI